MERQRVLELEGKIKLLKLISPALARLRGVEAESPVFISPIAEGNTRCEDCRERFGPLVYQAGYTVESQHFHKEHLSGGGIYYIDCGLDLSDENDVLHAINFVQRQIEKNGWLGEIDPINPHSGYPRSQAVYVKSIRSFCTSEGHFEELDEGFAVPAKKEWGLLVPVCSLTEKQISFIERFAEARQECGYKYIIRDGQLHFSQL